MSVTRVSVGKIICTTCLVLTCILVQGITTISMLFADGTSRGRTLWYAVKGSGIFEEKYVHRCDRIPKIVIYNRIPKAGSSTTIDLLNKLQKANRFTLHHTGAPHHNYTLVHMAIEAALRRPGRTLICGHFAYPEVEHGDDIVYINLLREPVSRIVSEYYYSRYGDRPIQAKLEFIKKRGSLSLNECVQMDRLGRRECLGSARDVEVGQSSYFCGRDQGECFGLKSADVYERGSSNMRSIFIVGVMERYVDFLRELELTLPEFFRNATELYDGKHSNVGKFPLQYASPDNKTIEFLKNATELDEKLYQEAVLLQIKQLRACENRK